MKNKYIVFECIIGTLLLICVSVFFYSILNNNIKINKGKNTKFEVINPIVSKQDITTININAVGDCTIGYDDNFGYNNSFNNYYDKYGEDHFFKGVKNIFLQDDLTFANLETTFTNYDVKTPKKFNFKAPFNYVSMLNNSSIEVVNIANNHIKDYGETGYKDTINTLNNAKINFIGYDYFYVFEKDNVKIGMGGIHCIEDKKCTDKIDAVINGLNELDVDAIIISFHWGIEKDYKQSAIQTYLAHYAIDNGADLILGHHPHVLQGIEVYNDKYIVYSLANFSFGGNKNPMIFNIIFTFKDKQIMNTKVNIYPARVSSVTNTNDYSPVVVYDKDAQRVLDKIQKYSVNFNVYDHYNGN